LASKVLAQKTALRRIFVTRSRKRQTKSSREISGALVERGRSSFWKSLAGTTSRKLS
jgi:hypothetical protein